MTDDNAYPNDLKPDFESAFQEMYGFSVYLDSVRFLDGSPEHMNYEVVVKYAKDGELEVATHHVQTVLGKDFPYSIDHKVTPAGRRFMDELAEFGRFIGEMHDFEG